MEPSIECIEKEYRQLQIKTMNENGANLRRQGEQQTLPSSSKKRYSSIDNTYDATNKKARTETKTLSNFPFINFSTYQKLPGSVDFGKEYEYLMCGLYALKLSTSKDVVDFEMSTNNTEYGLFDDIGIKVTFKDKKTSTFLLQLKHKEREKCITRDDFTTKIIGNNQKNPFYLGKYLDSLSKIKISDAVCILYTNCPTNIKNNMELYGQQYCVYVEECGNLQYGNLLLNTQRKANSCTAFHFKTYNNRNRFYFFTQQDNIGTIKDTIENTLNTLLHCDIYGSFVHFMKQWWSGNFLLTKCDFIAKLTELTLSPYTKVLSAKKHNEKSEQLAKAIMTREMTLLQNFEDNSVEDIWTATEEHFDLFGAMQKFGLTSDKPSAIHKSKILWYLGKVPLIVKVEASNEVTIRSILQLLRTVLNNRKIVLLGSAKRSDFQGWKIFENLFDIRNTECYLKILQSFKVSLQERRSIFLKQLVDIDEDVSAAIGVPEIFKMSQQEHLLVGGPKKKTDLDHISRTISTSFVNTKRILSAYKYAQDCLIIIINCTEVFKKTLLELSFNTEEISEYLEEDYEGTNEKIVLFSTTHNCSVVDFEQICKKSGKSEVYLLQVYNDDSSIVLLRQGNKLISRKIIYEERGIEEAKIFDYFENSLNVVCAPPGMGKSRLFEILSSEYCPPHSWSVHVNLINHKSFLQTNPSNQELLSHFLELEETHENVFSKIKNILLKRRKLQMFLDGLDEVNMRFVNLLLKFAKYASTEGVSVWISSRENLRDFISNHLHTVPIEILKFSPPNQKEYIKRRLQLKYEEDEIEKIILAVFKSADVTNSQQLLGIPLQLFIITEMLLNNEEAYETLNKENIFVLTKMYQLFFEGKKKIYFQNVGIVQSEEQLDMHFNLHLKLYQIPALKSCLDDSDLRKSKVKTKKDKPFVEQIKKIGDKYGIIKQIVDEDQAVFVHQTFAEFFACVWLKTHPENVKLLGRNLYSEKYQNLRLIFDIMMAEENPLHLAIIYKNIEQVEKHISHVAIKDKGDRTVLDLACSHGTLHPHSRWVRLNRESDSYTEILERVLQECDNFERGDLLNCIDYAVVSNCLYALEKILEKELTCYEELEKTLDENMEMLAYYAAQLGYPNLLSVLIKKNPELVHDCASGDSLLHVAVLGSNDDTYSSPREGNIATIKILIRNGISVDQSSMLEYACQNGCYDTLKVLTSHFGAKCTKGNTVLHKITEFDAITPKVIEILKSINTDANDRNDEGATALQIACEKGNLENVRTLLQLNSDVNIADDKNKNSLHYVFESRQENTEIIDLLLSYGVNVNAQDETGRTPLHMVCFKSWIQSARKLLEHKADANIVDNYNQTVLYSIIQPYTEGSTEMIDLLISYGVDVNTQQQDRSTALHHACTNRQIKYVKKLLELGADAHIVDDYGMNALHYAVLQMWDDNTEIIDLLIKEGLDVNAQDEDGKTPLHLACQQEGFENVNKLLQSGADAKIVDNNNASTLHYAAQAPNKNTEIIDKLINHGFDINAQDKKGRTPFVLACQKSPLINAKQLLGHGADVNIVDYNNNNALHYVALSRHEITEMITLLIDSGFDINYQNDEGVTPLHLACRIGQLENVEKLLRQGADVNILDHDGKNVLHYTAKPNGEDTKVMDLMLTKGLDVNARDKEGGTPLLLACLEYHFEGVNLFLEHKADVNIVDGDKMNALHYAAQSNKENHDIINLLIGRGFDINAQDQKGRSPLHFASLSTVGANFKLIARTANINVVDNENMTVLHYAAQSIYENIVIIKYLLVNFGFSVNVRNDQDETSLHIACKSGNIMNINVLLKHGSDINAVTTSGRTILHCAAESQYGEVVLGEVLLNLEVDINACDSEGTSVLHTACRNGDYDTVKLLIDKGADVNCVDLKKRNVLHYAVEAKKPDARLVELLIDAKPEDLNEENVLDYAVKNECYGAIKILIEANIVSTNDVSFLYYSVFSGCCYGVNLFSSERGLDDIDTNNNDFPLNFATKNGKIDMDLLIKMTQFIDKMIEYSNESSMKYSHQGLIAYLGMLFSSNEQIDLIFNEVHNLNLINRRFRKFQKYLKEYFKKPSAAVVAISKIGC